MALTLTEAAKLSNDVVLQGVIETVVKDSPLLQRMPFIDISGNAITYNRENAQPTAAFFQVGDTWTESTPTFTQITTSLTILGGDADVDRYVATTRNNVQDIEAAVLELKAKAVRYKFEETFIAGDTAVDSKSFDGIRKTVSAGQTIDPGGNGTQLTLALLDQVIDTVRPGRPDLLLMSRRSRRTLNQLVRASGAFMETRQDEFGAFQEFYAGVPIGVCDFQPDNETQGASNNASSVYALQFGEGRIAGLQGAGGLQIEHVGTLETKDASRWRVKWYCNVAVFADLALARLKGIIP
ncbi:MAG: phage major capsid protein [Dehalococcoidia bacterium]